MFTIINVYKAFFYLFFSPLKSSKHKEIIMQKFRPPTPKCSQRYSSCQRMYVCIKSIQNTWQNSIWNKDHLIKTEHIISFSFNVHEIIVACFYFYNRLLAHEFNLISGIYTLVHQRRCHEDDEIIFYIHYII